MYGWRANMGHPFPFRVCYDSDSCGTRTLLDRRHQQILPAVNRHCKPEATTFFQHALDPYPATLFFYQLFRNVKTKAQAYAACCVTGVDLVKPFEDIFNHLRRDPATIVGNRHHVEVRVSIKQMNRHFNRTVHGREFYGIAQQV